MGTPQVDFRLGDANSRPIMRHLYACIAALVCATLVHAADPVLNMQTGTLIYQKGDGPLDVDSTMTVTQLGGPAVYDLAVLTCGITANVDQADVLSIQPGDNLVQMVSVAVVGQTIRVEDITNSSGSLTYGPQLTVASWSGGSNNSSLVITFNRNATLPRLNAVLDAIAYSSTNVLNPPTADRTITCVFSDGTGTTNADTKSMTMRVVDYNAPPTTSGGTATTLEDQVLVGSLAARWVDGDSASNAITYYATGTPVGGTLISLNQNTGAYQFQPTANFNGTASFQFYVRDERSASNTSTITITVTAVNDAPLFAKGGDVTVLEDSGAYSQLHWATAISAGPGDEVGQTVHFNVTANSNPSLFASGPTIAADGSLSFTPALHAWGSANITITAQDDGGTANGGIDTSASQAFAITISHVDIPPTVADVTINSVVGIPWSGTVAVADPDSTLFSFYVAGISRLGELNVDQFTGAITFNPQTAGSEDIPFTVNDGTATVAATLHIRISDFGTGRPRITSTPPVEVAPVGSTWQYDVVIDPQSVLGTGVLGARLDAVTGATLTKMSGNRFRISYPIAVGSPTAIRFGIVVTDTVNNLSDYQAVVIAVHGAVGGG